MNISCEIEKNKIKTLSDITRQDLVLSCQIFGTCSQYDITCYFRELLNWKNCWLFRNLICKNEMNTDEWNEVRKALIFLCQDLHGN